MGHRGQSDAGLRNFDPTRTIFEHSSPMCAHRCQAVARQKKALLGLFGWSYLSEGDTYRTGVPATPVMIFVLFNEQTRMKAWYLLTRVYR